jgi:hypothetical protein
MFTRCRSGGYSSLLGKGAKGLTGSSMDIVSFYSEISTANSTLQNILGEREEGLEKTEELNA